jgi:tight adherence protein B
MIAKLFIACLAGSATGIFTYEFLTRSYSKILYFRDLLTERTETQFSQLHLFVDISRYIYPYLALLFIVPILVAAVTGELVFGLLFFVCFLLAPHFILNLLIKKRLEKFERQLPDAMLSIASSLRAGASLSIALDNLLEEASDPLRQEFALLVRERTLGVSLDTALVNMEKRLPLEDLYLCFSAFQIAQDAGGNLAETLESLAETLRRKIAMEGRIDSLTAQGKMQGWVMSSLPLLLMAVLMRLEPDAMGKLFHTKIGLTVLVLIISMQILGFLSIRKITNINV